MTACRRRGWVLGLMLVVLQWVGWSAQSAWAAPEDFPRPPELESQVEFWRRVFGVYSRYQLIFHDERDPQKIYKIVDFRPLLASGVHPYEVDRRMRLTEDRTIRRIEDSLWQLHRMKGKYQNLNRTQSRIVQLFPGTGHSRRFANAQQHVRVQRGLKEKTRQALITAGQYLPQMEAIFQRYQLPVELTRLPIVESSFNVQAYSKVGAAGLWQFMPASAKHYMQLDDVRDDRRDPWISTDAAARHLRDDYRLLQNWGLAVTAYNHGRTGVSRAAKAVGSQNIADIVRGYRSESFGFASRNFYTEFLAAMDVYRHRVRYFGPLRPQLPIQYDVVSTKHYLNFATLARMAGMTPEAFAALNPSFHPQVQTGRLRVPPQLQLRVPKGSADRFNVQYASLNPNERFVAQLHYYRPHKVMRGDSVSELAQRYGVSSRAILAANGMKTARLRIGRTIRIPPSDTPSAGNTPQQTPPHTVAARGAEVTARPTVGKPTSRQSTSRSTVAAKKPQAPRYVRHKVKAGQTLGHIAQRYDTSVRKIQRENRLSNNRIRVGQVLKIPL